LTTDIIVGFPGETDPDYKATRDLVEDLQFDNAFIFRYSPRRETPAASMDQIDEATKEARNQDLLGVVNASTRRANEKLVGTRADVLCEGPSKTNAFDGPHQNQHSRRLRGGKGSHRRNS
jgi:tRNA-2-methylthio-N6-dimethylallyladenosine synthase